MSRGCVSCPLAKAWHRRPLEQPPAVLRTAGGCSNGLKETFGFCAVLAPPLLVSFSSIKDYLEALPESYRREYEEEIVSLFGQGLPPVVSARCLAILFGYSTKFVQSMSRNTERYYRSFSIRQGKKQRKIQAPKIALKVIQKWLGYHLAEAIDFNDHVYGFVRGRSAADAAAKHCEADWVYSVDILNFFPSTGEATIRDVFLQIGYSEKATEKLLTPMCCFKGSLPQGAPSSPFISNLALEHIDTKLYKTSAELGATYTRYADDIVFSGKGGFPEKLKTTVRQIFMDSPWKLSANKEHFADGRLGQRLKVHGLLINNARPRLTKGYRNKIRAYKHLLESGKVIEKDIARLSGHLSYANSIDRRNE